MTMRWTDRWGPLTGVAGIALLVISFIVAGSSPDTGDPDAKIVSYIAKDSNQTRNLIGWLIVMLAILCLLAFVAAVRNRLAVAEGGIGRFATAALVGGIVSIGALAASIAMFVAPVVVANDTSRYHIDPNTYRLFNDFGYEFWVLCGVAGALFVWSTMVVAFRTALLPRWFGWFSAVVGVFALATVVFLPMFVYWLWIVFLSILLVRVPTTPTAAVTDVT